PSILEPIAPQKPKRPKGRPKTEGERVKITLSIPVETYAKIKELAEQRAAGNVTYTINAILNETLNK
nr:hypothetical protein [Lachnospiraceae bacterium]